MEHMRKLVLSEVLSQSKGKAEGIKILKLIISLAVYGIFFVVGSALAGECNDGIDNDGDGKTDQEDYICLTTNNEVEWIQGEMKTVNVARISHPAYMMGTFSTTYRNPFNVDNSRVFLDENSPGGGISAKGEINPRFDGARGDIAPGQNWIYDSGVIYKYAWPYEWDFDWIVENNEGWQYYSKKESKQSLTPRSYYYDQVSRIIYIITTNSTNPKLIDANNLYIRKESRGLVWGCIADNCLTETNSSTISAVQNINAKLQDLNFDAASSADKKLDEWDRNTIYLPYLEDWNNNKSPFENFPVWSPYEGETNIVYAICKKNHRICFYDNRVGWLVRYNVDTGEVSKVFNLNPHNTTQSDIERAEITGFAKDALVEGSAHQDWLSIRLDYNDDIHNKKVLIIDLNHNTNGAAILIAGPLTGWNLDFPSGVPYACSQDATWWPHYTSVHADMSPDGLYNAYHGDFVAKNDFNALNNSKPGYTDTGHCYTDRCNNENCIFTSGYWGENKTFGIAHVSWRASNDWYVGSMMPIGEDGSGTNPKRHAPHKSWSRVFQVIFDREKAESLDSSLSDQKTSVQNRIINQPTAGFWEIQTQTACSSDADCLAAHGYPYLCATDNKCQSIFNYNAAPLAVESDNGKKLYFQGTNNKYTTTDYEACKEGLVSTNCNAVMASPENWESTGIYMAELEYVSNSADVNGDGKVNIKDIQVIIREIINPS